MSEELQDTQLQDKASANEKKAREPKKNSIPMTDVKVITAGLPSYDKTSWHMVGHKNGVRLAITKTTGVSRIYFYANNDYSLIPDDPAIRVFNEADRKENNRGGVMAEINFEQGVDAAKQALTKLVAAVKSAPAPVEKPKAAPKVKKVKAEDGTTASVIETQTEDN